MAWYFSSKATNLYDDFRAVKFINVFLLIVPNVMIQMMVLVTSFFMLDDRVHARKVVFYYVLINLASDFSNNSEMRPIVWLKIIDVIGSLSQKEAFSCIVH